MASNTIVNNTMQTNLSINEFRHAKLTTEGRATVDRMQNLTADPGIKHDYSSPDVVSGIAPWRQASTQQFIHNTVTTYSWHTSEPGIVISLSNDVISLLMPWGLPA